MTQPPKEDQPEREPKVMFRALSVCGACWTERNPDRPASHVIDGPMEECIVCEQMNTDGIYVRMRVEWR